MPPTLLDTFTDDDLTPLYEHTPDVGGGAWVERKWTTSATTAGAVDPGDPESATTDYFAILCFGDEAITRGDNKRTPTMLNTTDPGADEYDVAVTMGFAPSGNNKFHWLVWRATPTGIADPEDPANADAAIDRYMLVGDATAGRWELWRTVGGSPNRVLLDTYDATLYGTVAAVVVQVRATGTTVLVDGVERLATTDTAIAQRGLVGIGISAGQPGSHYIDDLSVTPVAAPTYTLGVTTNEGGAFVLDPAGGTYDAGTVVQVTAAADPGWQFDGWSGDATGADNPLSVTMDADKDIIGAFSLVPVEPPGPAAPTSPPCDWPTVPCSDAPPQDTGPGGLDEPVEVPAGSGTTTTRRALLTRAAVEHLWNVTGRQYGVCDVRLRPCRQPCAPGGSWLGAAGAVAWSRSLGISALVGGSCGRCEPAACACEALDVVRLPGPVVSVERVLLDGVEVDPSTWALDGSLLYRTSGEQWPTCQDLTAAFDAEGAFTVEYRQGVEVPAGGALAAGVLACELQKGAAGQPCSLPERVTTITRQGVTMAMLDPFEGLEDGRTGIWTVDSWVASLRASTRWAPRVWSPDVLDRRRARPVP